MSRVNNSSQSEPQRTLITFQPAPRNAASSSLMILTIASNRAIETLQVAVHDEDQIVELLSRP